VEETFKNKFEHMNAEDISKIYYCFTEMGFKGEGRFYKYLQKCVSKGLRSFEGPHLALMFHKFDQVEETKLNSGVRRKIMARVDYLIGQGKIKASDVDTIYKNTKGLPLDHEDSWHS
jgi:hypothetical protein